MHTLDFMNKTESHAAEYVPELVCRLYALVGEFEALFPGRSFTPDGHLVGSIGEVLAAYRYNLTLNRASSPSHDALAPNGKQVEIKATQGKSVGLRAEPEQLIVLQLDKDGHVTEVFNGPGSLVWSNCGEMQKNGQRVISVSKLRKLMTTVPTQQQIPVAENGSMPSKASQANAKTIASIKAAEAGKTTDIASDDF